MVKQQPRFKLKLYKNNKIVLDTDSRILGRFSHLIASRVWDKAYIKVTYLPTVFNDGEYTNKKELVKAWRSFIDADLIKSTYLQQW